MGPTPLGPRKRKQVNYAQSPANQKAAAERQSRSAIKQIGEEANNDVEYSGGQSSGSSSDDEAHIDGVIPSWFSFFSTFSHVALLKSAHKKYAKMHAQKTA